MSFRMPAAILTSMLAFSPFALAQDDHPGLDAFQQFFSPFPGHEWLYHTKMTSPDGATIYEGTDVRRYRSGMRGRFVIEDVYSIEDDGSETHVAVQLMGFDVNSGEIRLSAFWPWQAALLGDVTAEIGTGDHGETFLTGNARPLGKENFVIEFGCGFVDEDIYVCRSMTYDGAIAYESNVETYTRRK